MGSLPLKLYWNRETRTMQDDSGEAIQNRNLIPSIIFGQKLSVNLLVVTDAGNTPYTGYATGVSGNVLVDDDYANPAPIIPLKGGDANWTAGTGSEYYYSETDDISDEPASVRINDVEVSQGTVGSLAAGTWGWDAANGRLYVRLSDDTDPDLQYDGYVSFVPSVSGATKPFIEADAATFCAAGSWWDDDTSSFRDPDISAGEISFVISANTGTYWSRMGTTGQKAAIMQIQLLEVTTADLFEIIEFTFLCRNRIIGRGQAELEIEVSNYYTKAETNAIVGAYQKLISGLSEIGRVLADTDNIIVNNTYSALSRVWMWITGKLQTTLRASRDATDTAIPSEKAVRDAIDGLSAANVAYTPATGSDWTDPDPDNVAEALDDLAARLTVEEATLDGAWSDADGNADVDTGTEICDSYATLVTCSVAWLANIVDAGATAMRTMWVTASLLVGDDGYYGSPTYTVTYTVFGPPDIGTVDSTVFSVAYNETTHALELRATVGSDDWSVSAKRMEVLA